MSQKPLLILKLGSTFPELSAEIGDFEDWITQGVTTSGLPIQVINAQALEELPSPASAAGIILTGSSRMVTDREPWSERLRPWLQGAVAKEIPILAICYGHQLLADACGGTVEKREKGVEIGTVKITRTAESEEDVLLGNLSAQFPAQAVHWQSVTRLPPQAVLLASSDADPHQSYRIGKCAWGVQFHPEFSAQAMGFYLKHYCGALQQQGLNSDHLLETVSTTPEAGSLLQRFASFSTQHLIKP